MKHRETEYKSFVKIVWYKQFNQAIKLITNIDMIINIMA